MVATCLFHDCYMIAGRPHRLRCRLLLPPPPLRPPRPRARAHLPPRRSAPWPPPLCAPRRSARGHHLILLCPWAQAAGFAPLLGASARVRLWHAGAPPSIQTPHPNPVDYPASKPPRIHNPASTTPHPQPRVHSPASTTPHPQRRVIIPKLPS